MKKARVIVWLIYAISVGAFMVGLSGVTADAAAKPKMPSYPRVSGELQPTPSNPLAKIQYRFYVRPISFLEKIGAISVREDRQLGTPLPSALDPARFQLRSCGKFKQDR